MRICEQNGFAAGCQQGIDVVAEVPFGIEHPWLNRDAVALERCCVFSKRRDGDKAGTHAERLQCGLEQGNEAVGYQHIVDVAACVVG